MYVRGDSNKCILFFQKYRMTNCLELRDCLTDGMQMMFFQEQTSFTIVYVKGDSNNFILFFQKYRM